jgi:hypothetical protein
MATGICLNFRQASRAFSRSAFELRLAFQLFPGIALHERHVQRPPRGAEKGQPDQGLLHEEAEERQAAVEAALQDQHVGPGLVVAQDEVAAVAVQSRRSLDVPPGNPQERKDPVVDGDPGHREPRQEPAHAAEGGVGRRQQLGDRAQQQHEGQQYGVETQREQHGPAADGLRDFGQGAYGLSPARARPRGKAG